MGIEFADSMGIYFAPQVVRCFRLELESAVAGRCVNRMITHQVQNRGAGSRGRLLLGSQSGVLRLELIRFRLPALISSIQREWRYYAVLLLLFLLSFSIPIFVVIQMKDTLGSHAVARNGSPVDAPPAVPTVAEVVSQTEPPSPTGTRGPIDEDGGDTFATARLLNEDSFVRVRATDRILPQAASDFAALLWFKPRRMPAPGEVMVLLSKIDSEHRNRPGYQVTLTRDSAGVRAQVYWRSSARLGGWFNFTDLKIEPQRWIALALSVRRGRYLGLHLIEYPEGIERRSESRVTLLGGYDLGRAVVPDSKSDLLVGPFNKNLFRGLIGPWGVIRSDGLTGTLREALEEVARDPSRPGAVFGRDAVQFWTTDGVVDLSGNQHELLTEGGRK